METYTYTFKNTFTLTFKEGQDQKKDTEKIYQGMITLLMPITSIQ